MLRSIADIDRDINTLRKRTPILAERFQAETVLFHERGLAQLERDERALAARVKAARRPIRKRRCPTCGHSAYTE